MSLSLSNRMTDSSINNNIRTFSEDLKNGAKSVCTGLAAVILIVAHPIIGPLGSIACLFAAFYHGLALNYHWRQSCKKNENGKLIRGTAILNETLKNPYKNKNPQYTQKDLPRLEHESKRLHHENAAKMMLKWARGLAKCTIPVVGPLWALATEIETNGSIEMGCTGCNAHWDHETPEEKLQRHISLLRG